MSFRLQQAETASDGLRRIAAEQLRKALDELRDDELDDHATVHQIRKRFKKLRGLIRLVRPGLGKRYKELNHRFRDAGRRFSEVRDATSTLETLRDLRSRYQAPLADNAFDSVEATLRNDRRKLTEEEFPLHQELAKLPRELRLTLGEVDSWSLDTADGPAVFGGFLKTCRRGHRALRKAAECRDDESLHEWRKRMKYHGYHLRLLRDIWKRIMQARIEALDELCDFIGDDHDLAVLSRRLRDNPARFGPEPSIELLHGAICRRREELQTRAFRLGKRVCAEKPRALCARLEHYWELWKN